MTAGAGCDCQPRPLAGAHAVVTGGSSGLGKHFVEVLARAGAKVTTGARRAELLAELVAGWQAQGLAVRSAPLDVADQRSVAEFTDAALAGYGDIDVLVNNAGGGVVKPALEHTEADWRQALDVNLLGAFWMAQRVGRHMVERGRGSIVNIASLAALGVSLHTPAYSAAKAALTQLTRQLALEWARDGVRVNAICPGHFATELTQELLADPQRRARIERRIPLGRVGELSDLDGLLTLLASDASRHMTGTVIPVDGGALVRPV